MPKRTKKQSINYGLKAVGSAVVATGAVIGVSKIIGIIRAKVAAHRLKKFGKKGVGSSYQAKRFRKKNR
jgi:hypothetical protein